MWRWITNRWNALTSVLALLALVLGVLALVQWVSYAVKGCHADLRICGISVRETT